MSKRFMIFSTYPVTEPRHGGQLRTVATIEKLEDLGNIVSHFCLYDRGGYPAQTPDGTNIPFDRAFLALVSLATGRTDVDAAAYFFQSDGHFTQLADALRAFAPDVVVLNQPWLWPAVKAALVWLNISDRTKIIYASHNVESKLIIPLMADLPASAGERMLRRTVDIETDLCRSAETVICVSRHDYDAFKPNANRLLLVPNGISPREEPGGLDYWRNRYEGLHIALMVGSAHPPNASGFAAMLAPSLGFLAPDERVVVVGGACHLIPQHALYKRRLNVNNARVDFLGLQNNGGLSSLIYLSSTIILPIIEGGGTNIKTAEALYNKKTIVGTLKAFRGYEQFLDLHYVHIANEPDDFRKTLKKVLAKGRVVHTLDLEDEQRLESLTWRASLQPLRDVMR